MKILSEQQNILEVLFGKESPKIDSSNEGEFLIPKWILIAPTYGEAVQKVIDAIAATRETYNWLEGKLGPEYLRETDRKKEMMAKLPDYKDDRFVVVKAQLGKKYRGKSVEEVRKSFKDNEFGLGAFEVGCILLTHPEILQKYEDLWLDCAGDERSPVADGLFGCAPILRFVDGEVEFGGKYVGNAYGNCGSASGLLSQ